MKNPREKNPVEYELSLDAASLYIFFGGIASGIAIPPFEFYNSSKIINENKIFIRDFAQSWYHVGLPGISNDIYSTANFIKGTIEKIKPKRVFFVGNSMGGYAAILFANLLAEGEVIAFAPQTFISPLLRLRHRDGRWAKQIFNTYKNSLFLRKAWNLKSLMNKTTGNQKISVFVSKDYRLDYIHAVHIKNIPGVNIYEFDGSGHAIVKFLRDEGKLPAIMSGNYP